MTTTNESSTLKTPSSLSGGDLVSRLLAATPPYLYNVPLTPHSFFFSEMLRSFVQAKSGDSGNSSNGISANLNRRRKRSWRDTRTDRPLELTTKDKNQHENHHHHQQSQNDKYYHQDSENRFKTENFDSEIKQNIFDEKSNFIVNEIKTNSDDTRQQDFVKQSRNFYDDSSRLFGNEQTTIQHDQNFSLINQKIKNDEINTNNDKKYDNDNTKINQELIFNEQKNKIDYSQKNFIPGFGQRTNDDLSIVTKNFLPPPTNTDFLPNPLWYPPPYPLPQSYPTIDPLHFFIDLRVSGHIWDRKLNDRQLNFKNKNSSAFSVPQTKEYNNRPLNLTRDEASTSKNNHENFKGTHFILKNLMRIYKDIREVEKNFRDEKEKDDLHQRDAESIEDSSKEDPSSSPSSQDEENGKDIRALIGLELVVDYVKEPKEESTNIVQ